MFGILDVSASALAAQRTNMDTIAGNIANQDVTRDEFGRPNPYRRRVPLFFAGRNAAGDPGVRVQRIVEDPSQFHLVHDPSHPDALRGGPLDGYVRKPNVEVHTEMVNMMLAQRAYEANLAALDATRATISGALRLLA